MEASTWGYRNCLFKSNLGAGGRRTEMEGGREGGRERERGGGKEGERGGESV